MPVLELTDANWKELVKKSDLPVLVMFYSPNCPHCRPIGPFVHGYAHEYRGTVSFGKLNILSNQWTAERYGILSTPTFMLFCKGKASQVMVGFSPVHLKGMVEESLASGTECMKDTPAINFNFSR